MGQLNYWMPVYPIEADNAMAFHPHYFDVAVPNSSADYNYYEWNTKYRAAATANVEQDTRPLPGPLDEVDLRDPLVFVPPVGGLIQFSGQHLHSSVPNHSGSDPLLDRLSDGAHRRHRRRPSCRCGRRRVHRIVDPRLRSLLGPRTDARVDRRTLQRRQRGPRRASVRTESEHLIAISKSRGLKPR